MDEESSTENAVLTVKIADETYTVEDVIVHFQEAIRKKQYNRAWYIYRLLTSEGLSTKINIPWHKRLLKLVIYRFRFDQTLSIIRNLDEHGCKTEYFRFQLSLNNYLSRDNIEKATAVLQNMIENKQTPSMDDLSRFVHAYIKDGNIKGASGFIDWICEKINLQEGSRLYNKMLLQYVKSNDFENTMHLLNLMKRRKVKPTTITYNLVLYLCAKRKMNSTVEQLLDRMKYDNIDANTSTYNSIIRAHCDTNDLAACILCLNLMHRNQIQFDENTYNTVILSFREHKKFLQIIQYLMTLSSDSAAKLSLKQYTSIISSLPLAKETSAIVNRIIRYIREAKQKPDLVFYTALIDYYAKRALLDQTLKIYQAMLSDDIKPNVVTYTVLIDAYAKSGHLETGLKVFRSMHRVGIFPNEFTYCTIMDAFCNKSQINTALDFFDEMQRRGIKPDAAVINCLMDGYNRLGMIDNVLFLYTEMKKLWNVSPDNVSISIAIEACAYARYYGKGKSLYNKLYSTDYPFTERNFRSYALLLGKAGDFAGLVKLVRTMKERDVKPERITILLILSCVEEASDTGYIMEIWNLLKGWVEPSVLPYENNVFRFKKKFTRR